MRHRSPSALPANQVTDSGLDETSCFFADGDGQEVVHGHYYEELSDVSLYYYTSEGEYYDAYRFKDFDGGNFYFDPSRRKVGTPRVTW